MRSRMILALLLGAFLMGTVFGQPVGPIEVLRVAGYLGITIRDVTPDDVGKLKLEREGGVVIESVSPDSPAEDAGLLANDVLLAVSGVPILSVRQFQRLIGDLPVGRKVEIELSRAGTRQVQSVEVVRRPGLRAYGDPHGGDLFDRLAPLFDFEHRDRPGGPIRVDGRPRLGIQGAAITGQLAAFLGVSEGEGVLVMEVQDETPARHAGLRAGDVITRIDDHAVADLADLTRYLAPGKHRLGIVRDKREETLEVELGDNSPRRRSAIRM